MKALANTVSPCRRGTCNEILPEYPVGRANSSVTNAEVQKKKSFIFSISLGRRGTWFVPFISTDHQLYMQLDVLAYLYLILSKICGSLTVVYNEFKTESKSQQNLWVLKHFSCFLWKVKDWNLSFGIIFSSYFGGFFNTFLLSVFLTV